MVKGFRMRQLAEVLRMAQLGKQKLLNAMPMELSISLPSLLWLFQSDIWLAARISL